MSSHSGLSTHGQFVFISNSTLPLLEETQES
ncbi:hypothetical protein SETIT_9G297700v2 [Setaria italica]|uniref:Uncharacterized protein n=2 Tax=Setaria TaxID=4554 RepID=A0A368SM70_SETIT|nr:hypothetical protein SETIT_9G297700v2 [Setaria italica]TKV94565.1 hypothetical protein SEVIR_9G303666v2 [Setaria viridis]